MSLIFLIIIAIVIFLYLCAIYVATVSICLPNIVAILVHVTTSHQCVTCGTHVRVSSKTNSLQVLGRFIPT